MISPHDPTGHASAKGLPIDCDASKNAAASVPPSTRVFLIDDHPIVRAGARLAVAGMAGFVVCGELGTSIGAVEAARAAAPDIVVLDLLLGSAGDGLELVAALHAGLPAARLLVFSMNSEELFAYRALRSGARGYLTKGGDLTELQEALRAVQRGDIYLSPRLRDQTSAAPAGPFTQLTSLTDREMQVFLLLGAGKSTQQIADELGISRKTASAHRENIKVKLRLSSASELVRHAVAYVVGQGHPS
ncbi:MAG: response regulator transcription factor [Verrucomicrobiota bacterium]